MSPQSPTLEAPPERPSLLGIAIEASRPKTLLVALGPVAVGSALAQRAGYFTAWVALAALAGALLLQVGTNLHNDAADSERGADGADRLGPRRATAAGLLSPRQTMLAAAASFALSLLPAGLLIAHAGWPIAAIGLAGILCGLAYTGGPWPLAYQGLGEPFVFIFFGPAAVWGTSFAHGALHDPLALIAALPLGFLTTAVLVVNNLRDRHSDARANKRTIAVRFGDGFARRLYAFLLLGSYAWTIGAAAWLRDPAWLAPLITLPLGLFALRRVWLADGADLDPELGRTAALSLGFGLALAAGLALPGGSL